MINAAATTVDDAIWIHQLNDSRRLIASVLHRSCTTECSREEDDSCSARRMSNDTDRSRRMMAMVGCELLAIVAVCVRLTIARSTQYDRATEVHESRRSEIDQAIEFGDAQRVSVRPVRIRLFSAFRQVRRRFRE